MSDEDILKLQKRARHVARSKGYKDLAEDFSQWTFLQILENPDKKTVLDFMFIDYLRHVFGATREGAGKVRAHIRKSMVQIEENDIPMAPSGFDAESALISHDWIHRCKTLFKPGSKQRRVFELYFIQGLEQFEIRGPYLGITQSGVSLILKAIRQKIKKLVLNGEIQIT